ncbi:MAG: HYR domain-containing protein [Acidobacteria bacterium]|nr:HYR domain-containing protein [Acidobacteriota bacterium]
MRTLCRPLVLCALLGAAACGSETPIPPTPTPNAPTLSCPASSSLVSPDGAAVPLTFTVPTAVGGQLPVPVTCSKLSGSTFPLGSTIVTCTAVDALARQASCNFAVTVTAVPRISKTKFLALGDSITEGRCGPKPNTCPPWTVRFGDLLRERYTLQSFVVTNRGISGEKTPTGEDRLLEELITYKPEVLLLMEGTNDLTAVPANQAEALESLEDMIDIARGQGVAVFIATIAPIAAGGPNDDAVPLVPVFNANIRGMAARKNVPVVDVFAALNADIARYYVGDDLHPTAEGLRVIGETFYAAVRTALDITPTAGSFSSTATPHGLFEPPGRLSPGLKTRPPKTPKLPGR